MSDSFQKKIKLIDKNIQDLNSDTLELKESLELLKETTNLLNSAIALILSQNNNIDDDTNTFLLGNTIETYYQQVLDRKKIISNLNKKYKNIVKEKKEKSEEENSNSNNDNETDKLLNKKPQVELRFIMNKKEELIQKGQMNLGQIKDDIGEIKENLKKQKDDLEEIEDIVNENDILANDAEGIINYSLNRKLKSKMLLYATNILLFLLIIIIVIYKIYK